MEAERRFYEVEGVFRARLIDETIEGLRAYDDRGLWSQLAAKPREIDRVLRQYLRWG